MIGKIWKYIKAIFSEEARIQIQEDFYEKWLIEAELGWLLVDVHLEHGNTIVDSLGENVGAIYDYDDIHIYDHCDIGGTLAAFLCKRLGYKGG